MTVTPSPRRRAHMLQAHALRSRGHTIEQIARATKHAPSTVHAWLSDFEFERENIVAAVAQDQLLVLLHSQAELLRLHELHPPQSREHAESRNRQIQALASLARELRLVCAVLLRARNDHVFQYEKPEDLQLPAHEFDAVQPLAQLQDVLAGLLEPPPMDGEETESHRTEPNPPGQIETNLEISERAETRSPVQDSKSSKPPQKNLGSTSTRPSAAPSPPLTLPRPKRNGRPPPN